ncbi:hypothetical protein SH601_06160 [Gracilibacillus sp. S3-1-1]|uniref:Uncharacterized protein n=1 Tax=Gracilibacillus pellucidus TaxID=3095368 RepID=A0ACC6M4A2_9BACI|nr:hypothetical protein [Gracilibacillus sp. S3-1-1]MDX8045567.1 hypothetical protein [Gracilibacillus sp. S3-1-1]
MINSQKLKILGNDHFKERQEVAEILINGTATFHNQVLADSFDILGRCRIKDSIEVGQFVNRGSCSVDGKLTCEDLQNIGQGTYEIINADRINSSGSLVVNGAVQCQSFRSTGFLKLNEVLVGEQVSIKVSAPSKVCEIIGKETVEIKSVRTTLLNVISLVRRKMIAESIKGDNIYLENTEAVHVSGGIVEIGENCKINEVFYRHDLKVHPKSFVGKTTKI